MQNKQCKHYLAFSACGNSLHRLISTGNYAIETTLRVQRVLATELFSERAYSQTQASADQQIWSRWSTTECHHRTSLHWPSAVSYYILSYSWSDTPNQAATRPRVRQICVKNWRPLRGEASISEDKASLHCLSTRWLLVSKELNKNPIYDWKYDNRNINAKVILRFEH